MKLSPCVPYLTRLFLSMFMLLVFASGDFSLAQTFSSGSDGSDGALTFTTPGTFDFDPVGLGLDADGDNIYHFTDITIGAGVILRMSAATVAGPVFWLATDAVQIDGTIDLNGQRGQDLQDIVNTGMRVPSLAGTGGFGGGVGENSNSPAQNGSGPGKGTLGALGGGGAGHSNAGSNSPAYLCSSRPAQGGGPDYGNSLEVPLLGGSGGAGGRSASGAGGGAGGGALLIASSNMITVNGSIQANGGRGGNSSVYAGGGGSGGSIRLAAPTIAGGGALSAAGGTGGTGVFVGCSCVCCGGCPSRDGKGGNGASGRVRVEAFAHQHGFGVSTNPSPSLGTPFALFLPSGTGPSVKVVSVGGVPISNPTASFEMPDAEISTNSPINISVETQNIPNTALLELHIISENQADQFIDQIPLAGTVDPLTADVPVTLPPGFSRGYVRVAWQAQALTSGSALTSELEVAPTNEGREKSKSKKVR